MCNPVAIQVVTTVAAAAMTARSQQQRGRFESGTAKYNARVAENQAEETRRIGVEEENIQRRKTAELLSKQRAQLGAAGVELGSGSALQLQQDTVTLGEADALRIRSNVDAQVSGLQTQAELTGQQGAFAASAGTAQAAGTLLSGTARVFGTGVADSWFTPNSAATTTG